MRINWNITFFVAFNQGTVLLQQYQCSFLAKACYKMVQKYGNHNYVFITIKYYVFHLINYTYVCAYMLMYIQVWSIWQWSWGISLLWQSKTICESITNYLYKSRSIFAICFCRVRIICDCLRVCTYVYMLQ